MVDPTWVALALSVGVVIGIAATIFAYNIEQIKHRIKYKQIKRPCPVCAPWGSKGWVRPTSPAIAEAAGGEEHLPTFPCSKCGSSKTPGVIVEEYPRGEVPEMDEDGRTIEDHR